MNIYTLSSPYPRLEITAEPGTVSAEYPERKSGDLSGSQLIVRKDEQTPPHLRQKTEDEVKLSSEAKDRDNGRQPHTKTSAVLPDHLSKIRNPDHKLISWFKTAINLQDGLPETTEQHVSIYA